MRWGLVCVILVSLQLVFSFDNKEFKKCGELGFCRRNRDLGESASQSPFIVGSLKSTESSDAVTGTIRNTRDNVDLSFTASILSQPSSTFRIRIDELGESKRFEVPEIIDSEKIFSSPLKVTHGEGFLTAEAGTAHLVIHYSPFSIEFFRSGELVVILNERGLFNFEHYRPRPEAIVDGEWEETFKSHTDSKPKGPASVGVDFTFVGASHVYGIPEHATSFALKPTRGSEAAYTEPYRLYNLDVFEYSLDSPFGLYGSVPLMLAHSQKGTSAVFVLNSSEMYVDVNAPTTVKGGSTGTQTHWFAESGMLDIFVFLGPSPKDVLDQYTTLTGRPALPPRFSLAYHQCRWNYKDEPDVLAVDGGFDSTDIPCDVIWLDIEHTDGKKYFTWDKKLFPEPKRMQDALATKGRSMVTIVDPHIKRDSSYKLHNKATSDNLYVKTKDGRDFEGHCWPGASSYMDFLNPTSRSVYAEEYRSYEGATNSLHTWNDMNEPSVFNGPEMTMQKDLIHMGTVEHRDVHNIYGLLHNMASYDGMFRRMEGKRPFILTRSFFAGSQRIAGVWTGDNMAKWDHLEASQPMLLSLGVAGIPFVGADVGGFFNNPEPELLTRWYQAGAYQPFFRAHAHIDTKRREPWLFGEPHTSLIREAVRSRYRLLPYWYTIARESNTTGAPMMRPLWFEFSDDVNTFPMENEFMLGNALLVKPVVSAGSTSEDVYLPPSGQPWYDFNTGVRVAGTGVQRIDAPITSIPVLQRGGTIIPQRMRARRSSVLMERDPFTLTIALNLDGEAKGELYLDDGSSYSFLSGNYFHRQFTFKDNRLQSTSKDSGNGKYKLPGVTVERVVIRGLASAPSGALRREGGSETSLSVQWNAEKGEAVVKLPLVSIENDWEIVLQ